MNPLEQADFYHELALTSGYRPAHGDGARHLPTRCQARARRRCCIGRPAASAVCRWRLLRCGLGAASRFAGRRLWRWCPPLTCPLRAVSLLLAGAVSALEGQDIVGTSHFAAYSTRKNIYPGSSCCKRKYTFRRKYRLKNQNLPCPFTLEGPKESVAEQDGLDCRQYSAAACALPHSNAFKHTCVGREEGLFMFVDCAQAGPP